MNNENAIVEMLRILRQNNINRAIRIYLNINES